jgi:hypothetical protein
MKESAVDCVLFRNTNIVKSEKEVKQITSSGEIIKLNISDKPYSALCDYNEKCDFKCTWMPNPREKYPINTDTYNLKFSYNKILNIKKEIKRMFRENEAYSLEKIEEEILNKNSDIDKIFIYSALEELVNNRNEIVLNKFSIKGYIIYRGHYYIFQPFDLQRDELPIIYRTNPLTIKPEYVDLEMVESNYIKNKEKMNENVVNENIVISKFLKDFRELYKDHIKIIEYGTKNYYNYSILGYLYDRLNYNEQYLFIKYILTKYLQKSNNLPEILEIIEYLNKNNLLINYYAYIEPDKSKLKENMFVGFIINKNYYIIDSIEEHKSLKKIDYKDIKFIPCSKDLITKIKTYKNISNKKINKKYNIIYGVLFLSDDKKNRKFKIIDKSLEEQVLTKEKTISKRSKKSGIVCSSLKRDDLQNIIKKLEINDISDKKKNIFCEILELFFRMKNLIDNNLIWFEKI